MYFTHNSEQHVLISKINGTYALNASSTIFMYILLCDVSMLNIMQSQMQQIFIDFAHTKRIILRQCTKK